MIWVLLLLIVASRSLYEVACAGNDFEILQREFWEWRLKEFPQFSTSVGVNSQNGRLDSFAESSFIRRKKMVEAFLKRLLAINEKNVDRKNQINYKVLQNFLETFIKGYEWKMYSAYNPVNFLEGIHSNLFTILQFSPLTTVLQFENYLRRVEDMSTQINECISLMKQSLKMGTAYHVVSVRDVPEQVDTFIYKIRTSNMLYLLSRKDLQNTVDGSQTVTRSLLGKRVARAFNRTISSLERLKYFILNRYIPHTRKSWSVSSLPRGYEYYKTSLAWHTTTNISPEEAQKIGIRELGRIQSKISRIMWNENFDGSLRNFIEKLKSNEELFRNTSVELMAEYRNVVFQRIEPVVGNYFRNYSKKLLKIVPMSRDDALGTYSVGSNNGSQIGIFQVNLFNPKQRPIFDIVTYCLHETSPGHHLQFSYALDGNISDWRRHLDNGNMFQVPFRFPSYTAYVEGWGLYAEYLGEEMKLYKDKYELLGRYQAEILRAARLVVDPGIHIFNWTRDEAIQYLWDYTAYSKKDIEAEVDRYITWPGHACAYKIGEIKIKELREKAENSLGRRFDLKEFHDVVLSSGPMPLTTLEVLVDRWILSHSPRFLGLAHQRHGSASDHVRPDGACVLSLLVLLAVLARADD